MVRCFCAFRDLSTKFCFATSLFVLETDTYVVFIVVKIYILYIYTTNSRRFCVQTIFEMKLLFKLHSTCHSCPRNRVVHGSRRAPRRCCSTFLLWRRSILTGDDHLYVLSQDMVITIKKKKENA
ncbi:unnamed protein product [Ixodes pacificus]